MKQYRVTSEHFVHRGETGDDDAVMDAQDLYQIKKLAGLVTEGEGAGPAGMGGIYDPANNIPNTGDSYSMSPVGSNVSKTAEDRNALVNEHNAQPGTDLWFIIMFTKPYLNGSLRDHIERYLKDHPEYRPRPQPGD
jgi:hypothetical protein